MQKLSTKKIFDFLLYLETDKLEHSGRNLFTHFVKTAAIIKSWGLNNDILLFSLFHSIYGTIENKQILSITRRDVLQKIIGNKAESLVYINCALKPDYFNRILSKKRDILFYKNKWTNKLETLSEQVFKKLLIVEWGNRIELIVNSYIEGNLNCTIDLVDDIMFFENSKKYIPKTIYSEVEKLWISIYEKKQKNS